MKTLEVKKTASGQYKYRVVDSFSGEISKSQYGSFDYKSTIEQARSRFFFQDVLDATECEVIVLNKDGTTKNVTMTKSCFDKSIKRNNGYSQDQFLGRIVKMAGIAIYDDSPF